MEILFVLARSQNHFFFEMAEAIVFELRRLGVESSVTTAGFPEARDGLTCVVFPPHEYFVLEGHDQRIDESTLKRTIFISAEQPGSSHFTDNVRLSEFAGRVFDLNAAGVRGYQRFGVSAELLQLGYSPCFDRFQREREADLDVLFMGCVTQRRARELARCSPALAPLRSRIILSDNSRPNTVASANFLVGEEKRALLSTTALLLNIHQSDDPYFEWARVLDAIHCGAVVLTEHSTDFAPLVPGEHFVSCRPEALPVMIERLHGDPELLSRIRLQAYEKIRSDVPLSAAAELLASAAGDIGSSSLRRMEDPAPSPKTVDEVTHIDFSQEAAGYRRPPEDVVRPSVLFEDSDPELAAVRSALKELRLDIMDLRRSTARNAMIAAGEPPPLVQRVTATPAYGLRTQPSVSILTALYNHGLEITEALDSLLESEFTDWEIVVVNDGSTDSSLAAVSHWAREHPEVALLLLSHPINRGLGHARNTALDHARGEYVFVLDADNAVYPNGIGHLVTTLNEHVDASFAYGMLASLRNGEPFGLVSYFPWEPLRFRLGNYVDAMALFRRKAVMALGGYTTDRRLYGWEDYDLYCRFAEHGHRGAFLDEVVAMYRSSPTSMLAVSNISHTAAYVALKEHAPTLMKGVAPPP